MFGHRCDGTVARDVPAYRRFMPSLMPTRAESTVYFDLAVDVSDTRRFLEQFNQANPGYRATLFHVVMWALVRTLHERPRLNRFAAGGRLYDRDGIWIAYTIKKKLDDDSPLAELKRRFDPSESFPALVKQLHDDIAVGRSDHRDSTDKELEILLKLPPAVRWMAVKAVNGVDRLGLLPRAWIEPDPFFASVFVTNLGSLHLDAAFHHLYGYGTIPIFCTIGEIRDEAVAVDGQAAVRPIAHLRLTYDERVEDGLYAHQSLQLLRRLIEDPIGASAAA